MIHHRMGYEFWHTLFLGCVFIFAGCEYKNVCKSTYFICQTEKFPFLRFSPFEELLRKRL